MSKTIKSFVLALAVSSVAQAWLVSYANAAPPGYCQFYARTALYQLSAAQTSPACGPGLVGGRWSADYLGHYYWCLAAPFEVAEAESFRRAEQLQACRW